jgi:hypothetical protein
MTTATSVARAPNASANTSRANLPQRLLFTLAPFTSAALLFSVQPMMAKLVLPMFGGAAAVWTTCMMFYQAALLVGYAYVDRIARLRSPAAQAIVHGLFVVAPLALLPLRPGDAWLPAPGADPARSLSWLLLTTVGLPFVALSATAPTVQAWFARTRDPRAHDPYFLYAASNAGSLLGLVAYPLLIEPSLGLWSQSTWWAGGYLFFVVIACGCAASMVRGAGRSAISPEARAGRSVPASPVPSPSVVPLSERHCQQSWMWQTCMWLVWAFVPSSLMLGITSALTSDVAPFPLMWVLPLAGYLLSFVVAFGAYGPRVQSVVRVACPVAICVQVFLLAVPGITHAIDLLLAIHFCTFSVIALYFHGELAKSRPAVQSLTRFYTTMSFGGALGGIFNSLVAPQLFTFLAELPIVLVMAACLCGNDSTADWRRSFSIGRRFALVVVGSLALQVVLFQWGTDLPANLRFGLPLAAALPLVARPLLFSVSLGVVLTYAFSQNEAHVVYRERSFYGVSRVSLGTIGKTPVVQLRHGAILHGAQLIDDDPEVRRIPLTYYFRSSPIGQVFHALQHRKPARVALIGLGAGTLASYAKAGEEFTFFEIDPAVARIASAQGAFSYLSESTGACRVVLGDGRISLGQVADGTYDLIVCDAFSGDAIPTHLLTVEAMRLYLQKCGQHGFLAFHLTNLYVDLKPVLARVSQELELVCLLNEDIQFETQTADDVRLRKDPSVWAVIARKNEDLVGLPDDPRWQRISAGPLAPLWTDDAASLWPVLHWMPLAKPLER